MAATISGMVGLLLLWCVPLSLSFMAIQGRRCFHFATLVATTSHTSTAAAMSTQATLFSASF